MLKTLLLLLTSLAAIGAEVPKKTPEQEKISELQRDAKWKEMENRFLRRANLELQLKDAQTQITTLAIELCGESGIAAADCAGVDLEKKQAIKKEAKQ